VHLDGAVRDAPEHVGDVVLGDRLRRIGVRIRPGDDDREGGPARAGDEPLVTVQDPVIAVTHGLRLDAGRVGAGDLGSVIAKQERTLPSTSGRR